MVWQICLLHNSWFYCKTIDSSTRFSWFYSNTNGYPISAPVPPVISYARWSAMDAFLPYKYDDLFLFRNNDDNDFDKGAGAPTRPAIDFHFDKQSKIIKTRTRKCLPFKDVHLVEMTMTILIFISSSTSE